MIVIYPMLSSASVSPNVLPGIVKAIEKYILLYNTDDVLKAASKTTAGDILSTGSKLAASTLLTTAATAGAAYAVSKGSPAAAAAAAKAGTAIAAAVQKGKSLLNNKDVDIEGETLNEAGTTATAKIPTPPGSKDKDKTVTTTTQQQTFTPTINMPRNNESVSLEPTYLTVQTAKKQMQILGVKVVPFEIRSSEPIVSLITKDIQLKQFSFKVEKYTRMLTRVFHRIMRKIPLTSIKDKVLTGDPKNDVILGKTQYGKNMFLCINRLDLQNDDMLSSPDILRKLQSLGWASIVVLDDVNKRATFCMKEFGGICSVVPYSYIFSSLGKEHNKVYEDLEDVRKASGPFFRARTNRRKAFTEGTKQTTSDKYLELIQK
jgi:hypothetical protein